MIVHTLHNFFLIAYHRMIRRYAKKLHIALVKNNIMLKYQQ